MGLITTYLSLSKEHPRFDFVFWTGFVKGNFKTSEDAKQREANETPYKSVG